jgi:hypothetical protein
MPLWCEDDVAISSLEEVFQFQADNRAWSKELRRQSNCLVNSRLADEISLADYLTARRIGQENGVECQRRTNILNTRIFRARKG